MMNERLRQQFFWEQTKALQGRNDLLNRPPRPLRAPRRSLGWADRLSGLRRRRV